MDLNNIKNRVKNLLFNSKSEWDKINNSDISNKTIIIDYLILLVGFSSITLFIGLVLKIGFELGVLYILKYVLIYFVLVLLWFVFISYVINKIFILAFKNNQTFNQSLKLIVFGSMPILVFSIITNLFIYSSHLFLTFLSVIFAIYIIWQGLLKQNNLKENYKLIISVVYGIFILALYLMFRFFNEYI